MYWIETLKVIRKTFTRIQLSLTKHYLNRVRRRHNIVDLVLGSPWQFISPEPREPRRNRRYGLEGTWGSWGQKRDGEIYYRMLGEIREIREISSSAVAEFPVTLFRFLAGPLVFEGLRLLFFLEMKFLVQQHYSYPWFSSYTSCRGLTFKYCSHAQRCILCQKKTT